MTDLNVVSHEDDRLVIKLESDVLNVATLFIQPLASYGTNMMVTVVSPILYSLIGNDTVPVLCQRLYDYLHAQNPLIRAVVLVEYFPNPRHMRVHMCIPELNAETLPFLIVLTDNTGKDAIWDLRDYGKLTPKQREIADAVFAMAMQQMHLYEAAHR